VRSHVSQSTSVADVPRVGQRGRDSTPAKVSTTRTQLVPPDGVGPTANKPLSYAAWIQMTHCRSRRRRSTRAAGTWTCHIVSRSALTRFAMISAALVTASDVRNGPSRVLAADTDEGHCDPYARPAPLGADPTASRPCSWVADSLPLAQTAKHAHP